MKEVAPQQPGEVLHICSDFAKQRIYAELMCELDRIGVPQMVYVPVRTRAEIGVNRDCVLERARHVYAHVLRPHHRLLFRSKIQAITRDLLSHVPLPAFAAVHAHFLYSDGAVALELYRRFGIPYLVAVRNTDVNYFMRLRPDLAGVCRDIIQCAQCVVFVTPAYREFVAERLPASLRAEFREKARIVPNGLSRFWLDNQPAPRQAASNHLRLLYVGDFTRNKNIAVTIKAAELVNRQRPVRLTLIGGGGDGEAEVDRMLASGRFPFVTRAGRITKAEELLAMYRSHDIFVMPSHRETFGIAYLEALSQGLPVVHTRGQGIDGYFPADSVSEAVSAVDPDSVMRGVLALADRRARVSRECVRRAGDFSWKKIAHTYRDLYAELQGAPAEVAAS